MVPNRSTLHIFKYFFCGHAEKRLEKKAEINFKIYDFIYWGINNYNTQIVEYIKTLKAIRQ